MFRRGKKKQAKAKAEAEEKARREAEQQAQAASGAGQGEGSTQADEEEKKEDPMANFGMKLGDEDEIKMQIDVKLFMEHLKLKFNRVLDQITEEITKPKDLIIIDSIRPIFELIIDQKSLKKRNVQLVWLSPRIIEEYNDPDTDVMVFFVPPLPKLIETIGRFLRVLKNKGMNKQYHIVYYPKRTILCKYFLETNDMTPFFQNRIYDFNFDLIPLSKDLLSLEYPLGIKEMLVNSEFNIHNFAAESLQRIQLVFGKIPTFIGKGDHARTVMEILRRLEKEHQARLKYDKDVKEIDACIILDRQIDLLTPMCTQMTYNGLLDELLSIECNGTKIDRQVINMEDEVKEGKMNFYFSDIVFDYIKDLNMNVLGKFLQQRLMEYQELVNNRDNFSDLNMAAQGSHQVLFARRQEKLQGARR